LEAQRFHELLIAARDVVRIAVRVESLEVGTYALVLVFDDLPVLRIALVDEGRDWLADGAYSVSISMVAEVMSGSPDLCSVNMLESSANTLWPRKNSLHLLTRRSDVARRLDRPLASIVMLVQLFPEALKHRRKARWGLVWLSVRHCFVS
jgi:hypothetical protein